MAKTLTCLNSVTPSRQPTNMFTPEERGGNRLPAPNLSKLEARRKGWEVYPTRTALRQSRTEGVGNLVFEGALMSFFDRNIQELATGWYEATVKTVSDVKVSSNGNDFVNVQFNLDDSTEPVFQAATAQFYDRIVLATGNNHSSATITGERVALRVEVDTFGNKTVKKVQAIDAPRSTADFQQRRVRVTVETPAVQIDRHAVLADELDRCDELFGL